MSANGKLTGIIADDDGLAQEAVGMNAAPQCTLGRDLHRVWSDAHSTDAEAVEMRLPSERIGKVCPGLRRQPPEGFVPRSPDGATSIGDVASLRHASVSYRQAESHAKNALSFDTAEPWSRMMLGLCLSTASLHQQALGELQAALDLNPNFALGRTLLGWALLRAGSYEAAIAETGKPLRMSPMDSFAGIYTSIHGLALLGAGRFSEALLYLRSSGRRLL